MNTTDFHNPDAAATRHAGQVRKRLTRLAMMTAALAALAAVFLLYQHPDLAFDVATKLWTCL